MSVKTKQRSATNSLDTATIPVNERILRECHSLYTDAVNGLMEIGNGLGLSLLPPRKKMFVLLMGNHSAGKSSFINWYVEEHIQKTGVAIETQGFTLVTSGRKRETLTGNATLHLYPHFQPLQQMTSVTDYLTTEISTSKQKKFSLVTFVDTPGLVDGDMKYPFDVDEAILWLGAMCDLIFVFFDPMGQALCKRTLNIVEKLNLQNGDKMKFYLSKADEAGSENDRQRVMMQIVQELCKRPGLNKCGFDMPTIYIPNINPRPNRCMNQIEEVCRDVERTITHTVQNALNQLECDCERIVQIVNKQLQTDSENRSYNWQAKGRGLVYLMGGTLLPLLLLLSFLAETIPVDFIESIIGKATSEVLLNYTSGVSRVWQLVPEQYQQFVLGLMVFISVVLLILARWSSRSRSTLTRKQKKNLIDKRNYVQDVVRLKKKSLYLEYLQQCVTDTDL